MRRERVVVIPAWGERDAGKVFVIHEQNVLVCERWAAAAVLALKGTSGQIGPELVPFGFVAIARAFFNAFLASDVDIGKIRPLLDEMVGWWEVVRDPKKHPEVRTPVRIEVDDVEELKTLEWLRSETIDLHTGFSPAEIASQAISAIQALQEQLAKERSSAPPTSPPSSPAPSAPATSASLN